MKAHKQTPYTGTHVYTSLLYTSSRLYRCNTWHSDYLHKYCVYTLIATFTAFFGYVFSPNVFLAIPHVYSSIATLLIENHAVCKWTIIKKHMHHR